MNTIDTDLTATVLDLYTAMQSAQNDRAIAQRRIDRIHEQLVELRDDDPRAFAFAKHAASAELHKERA